jgi:hypothetical protein
MFVHAGMSLYGKVDQVPGLLHVATQFFHVNFVPLVPTGSFVVIEGIERKDDDPPGIPIGYHFRSLLFAWIRAGLWIGGGWAAIAAIIEAFRCLHHRGDPGFAAAMAVLSLVLFAILPATYRLTRAAPLRAVALARLADIEPEVVAGFFINHPSLANPEELDRQGI